MGDVRHPAIRRRAGGLGWFLDDVYNPKQIHSSLAYLTEAILKGLRDAIRAFTGMSEFADDVTAVLIRVH